MSGGGSDKSRAGFTSRVVVITETDGLDETGGRSREADKVTQLEARTTVLSHRVDTLEAPRTARRKSPRKRPRKRK